MFVIAGVTGNTGKIVADTLLERGLPVRVIVRSAEKGAAFAARGAEVAVADLGDAEALAAALAGARGAYLLIPPNMAEADFYGYQVRTAAAIGAAVRESRVPHVVFLSSIGAELESGTGPIAGLYRAEAELRAAEATGTVSTLLRAGYFVENVAGSFGGLPHGVLPTFFPADFPIDMITTRDIGRVAAELLMEGASASSVVELGGPGLTMNDVAAAIGEVTGQRPTVVSNPLEVMVETLVGYGVPASVARLYHEMTGAIIRGEIRYHGAGRRIERKVPVAEVMRGLLGG